MEIMMTEGVKIIRWKDGPTHHALAHKRGHIHRMFRRRHGTAGFYVTRVPEHVPLGPNTKVETYYPGCGTKTGCELHKLVPFEGHVKGVNHVNGWPVLDDEEVSNDGDMIEEGEEVMENKLYKYTVDGKDTFGHKLAVDSAGKWVMEAKNGGGIVSVSKKDVEEVLPYTVDVTFSEQGERRYSFISVKGSVVVGDVVLVNGMFGVVVAVDTKSRAARDVLRGSKVPTVAIDTGDL